jgi:dTDP-4-amino-4,6-dideoxygalactose transaminase
LTIDRDEFIRELRQRGIGTSVHFIPIPLHPFFSRLPSPLGSCPRALALYRRIVSLPLYPAMTEEEVHYVARCVTEVLDHSRRSRFIAPRAVSSASAELPVRQPMQGVRYE